METGEAAIEYMKEQQQQQQGGTQGGTQGGAQSGAHGVSQRVALVLCDVHLPGVSGVHVLTELRATLDSEVAIVMMSSNDHVATVERCVVLGADSYMLKPPRREEIEALESGL